MGSVFVIDNSIYIPKLKQITAADGKRVYVTPEGNSYPSVTTVLARQKKQFLEDWKARVGPEKAKEVGNRARNRGKTLHSLYEDYIYGRPIDIDNPINTQLFNQTKSALDQYVGKVYGLEVGLWSDYLKLGGTADLIAEWHDQSIPPWEKPKLAAIDFKNVINSKKEEWIGDYFLQCAAYAVMFEERTKLPVPILAVIIAVENENHPQIFVRKRSEYTRELLARLEQ